MSGEYSVSKQQEPIVKAPASYNQLVVAPPGTGKTHIVIARTRELIESQKLQANEILVLCFTRAAVKEIKDRVRKILSDQKAHDDLRFVEVRTFDSYATHLLLQIETDKDLGKYDYDRRIELATKALIDNNPLAIRLAKSYRHLIVDEIQDLTGVRARLVQELLSNISGGFTLLGDPAQGIYNFTLKDQKDPFSSDELLEWVRANEWSDVLQEMTLTHNHRMTDEMAATSGELRKLAEKSSGDPETLEKFRQFIRGLKSEGTSSEPEKKYFESYDGSITLLCRTNGEVLQLATYLENAGIQFHLRNFSEERGIPPWVGRIFSTHNSHTISRNGFFDRWSDLIGKDEKIAPEEAWNVIKIIEGKNNPDLEIPILHNKLLKGQRLPDELDPYIQTDFGSVSLSTIHGVKGREFDKVIVLEPEKNRTKIGLDEEIDHREESRILYVAATRARRELVKMLRTSMPVMWKPDSIDNRRWLSSFRGSDYTYMELGIPGDFESGAFASMYLFKTEAQVKISQDAIWERRNTGFSINIKKERKGGYSFFRVYLADKNRKEDLLLTQMSKNVISDMRKILYAKFGDRFGYPSHWMDVPVVAVVTEVLNKADDNVQRYTHSPYKKTGFGLGIRVKRMVYLHKG